MSRNRPKNLSTERTLHDASGFSIVETLVVLLVVGLAIIPLTGVQVGARQTVSEAGRYSTAVGVARSTLEQLRARPFGTVAPDTTQTGDGFTIATNAVPHVDPATGVPMPQVEELQVSVSWLGGGPGRSIDLSYVQASR